MSDKGAKMSPDANLPNRSHAIFQPEAFLTHPMVMRFGEFAVEPSLALPAVSDQYYRDVPLSRRPWSWFAGLPVVPGDNAVHSWPTDARGVPLTHVMQVDLDAEKWNVREKVFGQLPLPSGGVLQVFHDLVTFGREKEDAAVGAWELRWWPKSEATIDDFTVQAAPDGVPPDGTDAMPPQGYRGPVQINADVVPTIPPFLDLGLPTQQERLEYLKLWYWIEDWPHQRNMMSGVYDPVVLTPWDDGYQPPEPVSRMCGFGYNWRDSSVCRTVVEMLPLRNNDDYHIMLFDINPNQFLPEAGWFNGGRHMQVWIRQTDLAQARFDEVWCVIRSDG